MRMVLPKPSLPVPVMVSLAAFAALASTGCLADAPPRIDGCADCAPTADAGDASSDALPDSEPSGPACHGESGPHALAVRAVTLDGQITLALPTPALAPWAAALRVLVTDPLRDAIWSAPVDGQGRYRVEVPAGVYDVSVEFRGDCEWLCPSLPLQAGVRLVADHTLGAHIETVAVEGIVQLDGRALPVEGQGIGRGRLWFVDAETGAHWSVALAAAGPGSFRGYLPSARRFAVSFATETRERLSAEAPAEPVEDAMPSGAYALGELTTDTDRRDLAYDARSITLDAALTLDGRPLADDGIIDGNARGYLTVSALDRPGGTFEVSLGERGSRIETRVLAGRYHPLLIMAPIAEQDAVPAGYAFACATPTAEGGIEYVCDWTAGGIESLAFTTSQGRPSPPSRTVRGMARFVDGEGRPVMLPGECRPRVELRMPGPPHASVYVEVDRDGRFEAEVGAGTYDVWLMAGGDTVCPVGARRVIEGLRVDNAIEGLVIEGIIAPLSIEVQVAGAPLRDDSRLDGESRGLLHLDPLGDAGPGSWTLDLGETGPGRIEVDALAGDYRIGLFTTVIRGRDTRGTPLSQDVLPSAERWLGPLTVEPGGTDRSIDLSVVAVQGTLRIDAPFAGEVALDGMRWVRLESVSDQHTAWVALTGDEGRFEALLFADRYRMTHTTERRPDLSVTAPDGGLEWQVACDAAQGAGGAPGGSPGSPPEGD